MTREVGNPRASESEWTCGPLRLTVFHPAGETPPVEGLWSRLTGQDPESSTGKPKTLERVEIGTWEQAQLVLHNQPRVGRIDWLLNPGDGDEGSAPSLPGRLQAFFGLMNTWLGDVGVRAVTRVALGTVALLSVPDTVTGYRKVSGYLPFDVDRTVSSDFLYQINRPRPSATVPDVQINRLVKWSVARAEKFWLTVTGEGLTGLIDPEQAGSFVRVELDINTVPKPGIEIPRDRLVSLVTELSDLTREIVREGDIP